MGAEVVQHHDLPRPQRRHQDLAQVGDVRDHGLQHQVLGLLERPAGCDDPGQVRAVGGVAGLRVPLDDDDFNPDRLWGPRDATKG